MVKWTYRDHCWQDEFEYWPGGRCVGPAREGQRGGRSTRSGRLDRYSGRRPGRHEPRDGTGPPAFPPPSPGARGAKRGSS